MGRVLWESPWRTYRGIVIAVGKQTRKQFDMKKGSSSTPMAYDRHRVVRFEQLRMILFTYTRIYIPTMSIIIAIRNPIYQ